MELTVLLSKVFGAYLIIAGGVIVARQRYFISVISKFVEERLTRIALGAIELSAGLLLVSVHNDWSTTPATIVTLFGWLMALEGALYLALPDKKLSKFIKTFNKPIWYRWGGLLSILLGAYLLSYSLGWLM